MLLPIRLPDTRRIGATRNLLSVIALVVGVLVPAISATSAAAEPVPASSARIPTVSNGTVGIRLVDAPIATRGDPRALIAIVDHLAPGSTIHRRIEVSNPGAAMAQVSLYAGAASISGGSFLPASTSSAHDLLSWISLQTDHLSLAGGAKQMVVVTVKVPPDAAPGERYGIIWAQVQSSPRQTAGVTEVTRIGIRMYLSVGSGNPPAANFTIDTLTASRTAAGRPMVKAIVHNIGGRAVDLSGTLQLTGGPGGLSAGPFPVNQGTTVGIGGTQTTTTMLDTVLPAGPWNATITLHSGLLEVTAHAILTFPAIGQAAPVQATTPPLESGGSSQTWLLWATIALAAALLATIGLVIAVLRRRRSAGVPPAAALETN